MSNFFKKYLNFLIAYFVLIAFYASQLIKLSIYGRRKKIKINSVTSYDLNIVGPSNDWILSTIKKNLLSNKNLSNEKGLKINFFLHYRIWPFTPRFWFDLKPNILFFTHEDINKYVPHKIYRDLFDFYDYIFCMNDSSNKFVSNIITRNNLVNVEKVKTNHFAGVSNKFAAKALEFKRSKSRNDKFINLGFHCRPYNRKRPEMLPEIMKYLPRFKLICCGEGHSSMEIYNELITNNKVEFKNYKFEDLHLFYSNIDLLICCSVFEGGPTPLVEANAFGIPFLSTDVGFAKEVATNYDKVIDVNSDPIYMSECILELRKNIGFKSKKIITWEKIVSDFYYQLNRS